MRLAGMISKLFSPAPPAFGQRPTPSADLYFVHGVADLLGNDAGRPIRQAGCNLFAAGNRFVLVRYATPAELDIIETPGCERLFYVVDDDFAALAADDGLPADYRRRLRAFMTAILPRILALNPVIVAPSRRLLTAFGGRDSLLLEPAHGPLNGDFSHFEAMMPLRLVFAGTRSHADDLAGVAPGVAKFLDRHPHARLVTFLDRHGPPPLSRHRQVDNRPALDWPHFKALLTRERFHVALAPFAPTPANQARSANKVNDHAAFGAAGLYGRIFPYFDRITHGRDGLLVDHGPEAWLAALSELAGNPHRMRTLAEAGLALARRHGDPARLRRFWVHQLGL